MLDTTQIPNSIVNTNSTSYYDDIEPYSYISFVNFFNDTHNNLITNYNEYIFNWKKIKNSNTSPQEFDTFIIDRYITLLNDITLNYTDSDEQRFLTNLDLNNSVDKQLLIPFYINKIQNITDYYTSKRENLKFAIQKNGSTGSIKGITAYLKSFIIDQITQSNVFDELSSYTIDTINENLEIAIDEKYDTFSHYFDIDASQPTSNYDIHDELCKKYFSHNSLDYNKISFINKDDYIVQAIKQYPTFIKEFGFTFSVSVSSTDINDLKSKDFNDYIYSKDKLNVNTYNDLTKKYAGCDMYYISSNNEITSGLLFQSDAGYANTLNKKYTSIANVPANNYVTSHTTGGNFLPVNQGISYYNTYNKYCDYSPASGNYIAYFPDPNVCGNIYGTSLTQIKNYPYVWSSNIDGLYFEKSFSTIFGIPNSNTYQNFYAYQSDVQDCTLNNNFETLFNQGSIYSYKTDIYGNEYAIFKSTINVSPENTNTFKANYLYNQYNLSPAYNNILYALDGGNLEFSVVVSGNSLISRDSKITSDYVEWSVFGDDFYPYDILIDAATVSNPYIHTSGWYNHFPIKPASKSNTDTISGDQLDKLAPYICDNDTYNKILSNCYTYDGGDFTFNPTDIPAVSANNGEKSHFITNIPYVSNIITDYNTVTSDIITNNDALSSLFGKINQTGKCYIRYNNTNNVIDIQNVLSFIPNFESILPTIQNIDIIQDVLIISYDNNILINKLSINNNNKLTKSLIPTKIYKSEQSNVEHSFLSKYYFIESMNSIIFAKFIRTQQEVNNGEDKKYIIYPIIYTVSLDDLHENILYNPDEKTRSKFIFDTPLINCIRTIDTPIFAYNSLNNVFNITYTIHDYIDLPHIVNMSFIYKFNSVELLSNDLYLADDIRVENE